MSRTHVSLLVVVVAAALPFLVSEYRTYQLTMMLVYAIALLGLDLLTGYSGQVSLGHGAFYALGAYVTAIGVHRFGVPWWSTLPVSAIVGMLSGYLFGRPALRLHGLYLALATFSLAIATPSIIKIRQFESWTGGVQGIYVPSVIPPFGWSISPDRWLYLVVLVVTVGLFAVAYNLAHGRIGRALAGVRDHPIAAAAMGVDAAFFKSTTFGISAMYTAIAGSLGTMATHFVAPDTFTALFSTSLLVGVVVGGLGTVYGALVGAAFVEFTPTVADQILHGAPGVIYGGLLIVVVLVSPAGIAGLLSVAVRRLSQRSRRLVPATVAVIALLVVSFAPRPVKGHTTVLRIGQTIPYSGSGIAYSPIGIASVAYARMINETGGIHGRQIELISRDDGMSPPQTMEQTRRLVEQDDVLLMFNSLGTASQTAVHDYLNIHKVPQLFPSSGISKWNDPAHYPWTMGPVGMPYDVEARRYAEYLLREVPHPRIAVLYPNDDQGRDYLKGLREGLGARGDVIAKELAYESGAPNVDSEIIALSATGANVFVDATVGKFTSLSIRKTHDIGWRPLHFITAASGGSVATVLRPAGLDKSTGLMIGLTVKVVSDPAWDADDGMRQFKAFMKIYVPGGDVNDSYYATGYNRTALLVYLLKQCGDDLSRENVMRQAASLNDVTLPLLLPGIKVNTSPTDFAPIEQIQLARFDGRSWVRLGAILGR